MLHKRILVEHPERSRRDRRTRAPSWLLGSYLWSAVLVDLHRRCGHADVAAQHRDAALRSAPCPAVDEWHTKPPITTWCIDSASRASRRCWHIRLSRPRSRAAARPKRTRRVVQERHANHQYADPTTECPRSWSKTGDAMTVRYPCPCCGFLTLDEKPPGTYSICPVCWWEDDDLQWRNPEYAGGANAVSLRQARENFLAMGGIDKESLGHVRRPKPEEVPRSA
jgi:Cysteine-rich CPCC